MKLLSLFFTIIFSTLCYSQNPDRILFYYDNAGNQTQRTLCISCFSARTSNDSIKEISEVKDEDLLKFSQNDDFSYYPNPVKEELYLKWELLNENEVSTIEVYSLTGQLISTYKDFKNKSTTNIPFQQYPQGTYLVLINYSSGEQKSITILKN